MRKFLGLISLLYSAMIGYVLYTNILKNFLAPNMHIYLKVSLPILFIIGLVLLITKKDKNKFKVSDLFLLLPIIMLFLSGEGKLSLSLANNRMMDNNVSQNEETVEKLEIINEGYDFSEVYFDVQDSNYNDITGYITYAPKKRKYENYKIRVKGMILKNNSQIPKEYFIIGKYQISCCAADAKFAFYYAKFDKTKLKEEKWYQIEGILKPGKDINNHDIMYIDVVNIKEIDEKEEEYYIYPCYYYDDKCSDVTKYNFEY